MLELYCFLKKYTSPRSKHDQWSSFEIRISSIDPAVDPLEVCKETLLWMIISTFPSVILQLIFAVFGISYHRNLFDRKTGIARGCFT